MVQRGAEVRDLAGVIAEAEGGGGALAGDEAQRPVVDMADGFDPVRGLRVRLAGGVEQGGAVGEFRLADFPAGQDRLVGGGRELDDGQFGGELKLPFRARIGDALRVHQHGTGAAAFFQSALRA